MPLMTKDALSMRSFRMKKTPRVAALSTWMVLLLLTGSWGCATHNADLNIHVRNAPDIPVRYEGRLVGPYDDLSTLVDITCKHLRAQPVGRQSLNPPGYCALFFHAPLFESPTSGEKWFIPHIAPIGGTNGSERICALPMDPVEPTRVAILSLGDASSASHAPASSASTTWRPSSFLNRTTARTWEHDVLVFSLADPDTCTVYSFNGFSGLVTLRRGSKFTPVGTVSNDQGVIQPLVAN